MRKISFLIGIIALIIAGLGVYSCQKSEEDNNQPYIDKELNSFLQSKEFYQLKKNFNIKMDYLDFKSLKRESYPEVNVNVFYLTVRNDEKILGKLAIFSKEEGKKYNSLYEDFSKITEIGGITTIYTSKKQFVVNFNVEKVDNRLQASISINNVNSSSFMRRSAMHSNSEFPTSDDGWWDCTTRCYKIAKDACDNDAPCKFMCDLLGFGSYCTLSIAGACAIYCM